jgi:Ni,Fe-hydrogenase III small subunit
MKDAVAIGRDFELAARCRGDLQIEVVAGDPSSEICRVLGRSLHLRHLDAGSCNACDWELTALLNPVYDVRRLGIDFAASPRHADGVAVTGRSRAIWRAPCVAPDPRIVIAVGACAASGGTVGEGYASAGGVDRVLPVDVYIPGCPLRPEAILFGILVAVGRLDARRAPANIRSG